MSYDQCLVHFFVKSLIWFLPNHLWWSFRIHKTIGILCSFPICIGRKQKLFKKVFAKHFSPILPLVQWNWLGETRAPSCWIASDPTLSPPPAIMFLLHQLFTCIIPYQTHFTQSRDCGGWYEYVYVLAAAARTLWCKRREPEGSLLLHNKGRGSESLCLHELSTQSGLWPTSTERSEWKWTCGWRDSVVERECVWEKEW